jgi:hypothetical protein
VVQHLLKQKIAARNVSAVSLMAVKEMTWKSLGEIMHEN